MSRENQGLQVALIIFVMLAAVLGVTTFVFFRHYSAAAEEAGNRAQEAARAQATARLQQEEIHELKRLIGFEATTKLDVVQARFAEDMQTYAANFPEQVRFYRALLAYQQDLVRDKSVELADLKREIQGWKDRYEQLEGIKQLQVTQHQMAAGDARKALLNVQQTAREDRYRMTKDKEQMHHVVVKTRREADLAQDDADKRFADLHRRYQETKRELSSLKTELERLRGHDFTLPDGTICGVSYRLGLAWIDLGRADSLEPIVHFGVYPPDMVRLNESTEKGEIEVTKVLGDHLAEAQVIDEKMTDPILRGDKIHTPFWSRRPR